MKAQRRGNLNWGENGGGKILASVTNRPKKEGGKGKVALGIEEERKTKKDAEKRQARTG